MRRFYPHESYHMKGGRKGLKNSLWTACAVAVAAILIVAPGAPRAATGNPGSFSILAPPTFTATSSEYIFVIAKAVGEIQNVALSVNDGPATGPLRIDQETYHFRARLALGLNVLELKGSMENTPIVEIVGIFRTSKIGMRIRSPFPKYTFHIEQTEAKCKECHSVDGTDIPTDDRMAMNSVCLECHNSMVSERYVHGPIAVGTCAICHSFSSEPNKYELNQNSFDLCLLCHVKKAEALRTKNFTHGPLGAALCDICHEPHSSPNYSHLRQPSGEICLVCHKNIEAIFATNAFLHRPFEERKCSQCHDPHYSDFDFLLKKDGNQLCLSCHAGDMEQHGHPVGVVPTEKLPFEARFGEEGEFVCITCHNPHAGGGEKMLPQQGCRPCHTMM